MFTNPQKNLIQTSISESMNVVEFGAGNGFYALEASGLVGNSGKVFAIDINRDLLQKLSRDAEKKNISNIHIIFGDVEKDQGTSLANGIIDVVIIANTFFQLENKESALLEAKRILKKKGRVLLVEWLDTLAGLGPHKDHLVKKEDAERVFERVGFRKEREIDAGDHHYGIIFRKTEDK